MEIKISKTPKHVNLETTSPVDLATNTIGSSMRNVSFGELIVTRAHGGVSRALLKKTERL